MIDIIPKDRYEFVVTWAEVKQHNKYSINKYIGATLIVAEGPYKGAKAYLAFVPKAEVYYSRLNLVLGGMVETCGLIDTGLDLELIALLMFEKRFTAFAGDVLNHDNYTKLLTLEA